MAPKISTVAAIAVSGLLAGLALQGCGGMSSVLEAICGASTGSAFDDMKKSLKEKAAQACAGTEDTEEEGRLLSGRRLVTVDVCVKAETLEIDEDVAKEKQELTAECVNKYSNLSMSDLIDTEKIKTMVEEFMNESAAKMDSIQAEIEAKAKKASDAAHAAVDSAAESAHGIIENATTLYDAAEERQLKYAPMRGLNNLITATGAACVATCAVLLAVAWRRHARTTTMVMDADQEMLQAED
jgi:BMFP domain-containing protein YqiC